MGLGLRVDAVTGLLRIDDACIELAPDGRNRLLVLAADALAGPL